MSTSEIHGGSSETSTSMAVSGRLRALRIGLGIGTVVLGLVTLFWPRITLLVVAIVFGIQLIAVGGLRIASSVVSKGESGWLRAVLFIVGLLVLLAGLICLRNPALSLLGVAVVISFGWIVNGIVELAAATSPEMPGSTLH